MTERTYWGGVELQKTVDDYLREKQWGRTQTFFEWNPKREQLEATVFMKVPIWRYKISIMNHIGGEAHMTTRTENDVWVEHFLHKAEIGHRLVTPKGSWIQSHRADFVITDANLPNELIATDTEMQLKKDWDYVGQMLWWYVHGPLENPYPAPKGGEVDWDWREEDIKDRHYTL